MIQIFYIRDGKMLGSDYFYFKKTEQSREEVVSSFIKQFYLNTNFIPEQIFVEESFDDMELLAKHLSGKKGKKTEFIIPIHGEKRKLLNLVRKNAEQNYIKENNIVDLQKRKKHQVLEELQDIMKLNAVDRKSVV